jgi:hypothetical protein
MSPPSDLEHLAEQTVKEIEPISPGESAPKCTIPGLKKKKQFGLASISD